MDRALTASRRQDRCGGQRGGGVRGEPATGPSAYLVLHPPCGRGGTSRLDIRQSLLETGFRRLSVAATAHSEPIAPVHARGRRWISGSHAVATASRSGADAMPMTAIPAADL